MRIAMSFDQMDAAAPRLQEAAARAIEGETALDLGAGVYGAEVLATAAAAFEQSTGRLRRGVAESARKLSAGVSGARSDVGTYEQGVIDELRVSEPAA
ncbi:hypothetical protein [Microbacterium sp. P04]|uniref:hypothetical protein n=1 Tax=Microbacterium sp. P04 TaxID=3366947 RepID=UPI003745CA40